MPCLVSFERALLVHFEYILLAFVRDFTCIHGLIAYNSHLHSFFIIYQNKTSAVPLKGPWHSVGYEL